MIADALGQIDQGEQPETGATHFAPKAGGTESRAGRMERLGLLVRPLALRASRRLRQVPWRHTWIIALAVLLLILAFCGIFHERRTIRLETWSLEPAPPTITLTLASYPRSTPCPLCGWQTKRRHS